MTDDHYFEYIPNFSLNIFQKTIDIGSHKLVKVAGINNVDYYVFENSYIHHHITNHKKTGACQKAVNKIIITAPTGESYIVLNLSRPTYQFPADEGQAGILVKGDLGCGPELPSERTGGVKETFKLIRIPIKDNVTNTYLPLPIGVHSGDIPNGSILSLSTIYYPCDDNLAKQIETVLNSNKKHGEWQVGINTLTNEGPSGLTIYDNGNQIWPTI